MNIYLLRHGETDWNKEGRLQGHTDIPLNENGRIQMKYVAEVLNQSGVSIDLVIASPLSRAYESAQIVAEQVAYKKENILVEPLLIERCFGEGEGKTLEERKAKYIGHNYPQMEPLEDMMQRSYTVYEKVVNSYAGKENVLLVAHGAVLYAMITAVSNGRITYGSPKIALDQGSIYRIQYQDGEVGLSQYSEENQCWKNIVT